ncbi:hypothetical protein [Desulfosarcina cetonica]|uniref:hypothetical protein n=1 Tax=Desulfosarcina cetonica TaxID=90730 RepID=UPI0006D04514|nr:hypothetical protein [Desulfosarcina cetonica]
MGYLNSPLIRGTKMEQFKLDNLIYLDVEFIALKYEEITGNAPSSQLTRTEGMKAGLGIPVLSAGVHTQETRSYQLSSLGMLKRIWMDLEKYSSFEKNIHATIEKPQIFWVQGHITVSIWGNPKDKDEKYSYFQMLDKDNTDFSLVTKGEYTSSGYDSLLEISPAIQNNINIPVNALVKILYHSTVGKSFVSTPFLIFEKKK